MDVQRITLLAEIPVEAGLTGVMHTDSEYDDCIIIMSECHRQECSKSNIYSCFPLVAVFLPGVMLGVWISLYSCLRNESVEVIDEGSKACEYEHVRYAVEFKGCRSSIKNQRSL